ncbi:MULTISPECIES: reverse transcriptase domain-containing protein [unclassified Aurantimonas]|uniref:reverse transcriptase domain-containing protein n=1 Tax=unclassified Aurantimonas TaxID=2638230 RepID=UPI002E193BBA|nr:MULTISPECIES: reverse transcriptase domain-containing protein [unclassified Aurantimonas]MEC5293371.1 reverse transcriptase domain-containing protein [Aurantimonas sp. C2-3-R2]MEC5414455.1 reverse transcriptase domain-containing protein [Aurantimonas sp. C2-4-R8]
MTDLNLKKQLAYIDRELRDIFDYCRGAGWTKSQTQEIDKSIARYRKDLLRVAKAAKKGQSKQRAVAEAVTLKSQAGMFLCLLRMHMRRQPRPSFDTVMKAASSLSVWKPTKEAVTVYWERNGPKFRMITKVGIHRGAQQLLLKDTLSLMNVDSEYDYTRKGVGGERAFVRSVCSAMVDGFTWWWTPDIKDCFTSITPKHVVSKLPVNSSMLRTVVFLPKCAEIKVCKPEEPLALADYLQERYPDLIESTSDLSPAERVRHVSVQLAQQGLPQGSMLSPLIARGFIGRELRQIAGGEELHVATIMDDLCIGSCGTEALNGVAKAVKKRLLTHPAGSIEIHDQELMNRTKVDLLGYRFQYEDEGKADPVHVKPNGKRWNRYRQRLLDHLLACANGRVGRDRLEILDELFAEADRYGRQWYQSTVGWTKKGQFSWQKMLDANTSYVSNFAQHEPFGWDVLHAHGLIKQEPPVWSKA